MTTLVIDVGSSSARALLVNDDLQAMPDAIARREVHFQHDAVGAAEIDALALRQAVETCIDEVLQHPQADDIQRVGMATFVGNVLGVDAQNQPQTPIYTYADTRCAPDVEALRPEIDVQATHERTGCPHHTAYHPAKWRWLYRTQPDAVQHVTHWLDFATYCYRTWFARPVPCSYSIASWGGLFNHAARDWDARWLQHLPITPEQLPPLADYDAVQTRLTPDVASRWPVLRDVPFYLAVGDGAAANIGSGGNSPSRLVLTIGTTAALRIVTTQPPATLAYGLWRYRVDAARFLIGGATSEGGNIFAWMTKTLRVDAETIESALRNRAAGSHGLTVLPLLAGERSMGYATSATGVLHGVSLSTTPLDIAHALLESVALRLALIASHMPIAPDAPVYAGGGAMQQSTAWAQLIAHALGRPVYRVQASEVTARGIAALLTNQPDSLPPVDAPLLPDAATTAALRHRRDQQQALYQQLFA